MSVLYEYHFDSLKTFAATLKKSDWTNVTREFLDYYLANLNDKYQQVVQDTQALGRNENSVEAEQIYSKCKKIIEQHIARVGKMNRPTSQYFGQEDETSLEMPPPHEETVTFSGNYIDWCDFIESFSSSVHFNKQMSNAEKLRRLLASVTGHAARVLGNWSIFDGNYISAINKLRGIYGNKYLIARSHIEALESRPPICSTFESITELVDEIERLTSRFNKVDMPAGYWDATIITVVEKRLDERTKESWTAARHGEATAMPTLPDLVNFLRCRALAIPSTSSGASTSSHNPWMPKFQRKQSPLLPKMEMSYHANSNRNTGRKAVKNGDCYICQNEVHTDCIECQECPASVHFKCLKNAGVVSNKKAAQRWKCNKCLRCAQCRGSNKTVKMVS